MPSFDRGRSARAWKTARRVSIAGLLALCGPALPVSAQDHTAALSAAPAGLAPEAQLLLRRTSDILARARSLTLDLETLREVRLGDGGVATLSSSTAIAMRRPNGLRVDIRGEATMADIVYDGTRVVVRSVLQDAYAEAPAPNRIDELLPMLQDKLGLPVDVGDLLVTDPFAKIAADTVGGIVSAADLGGIPAWHMVLRSGDVSWEFWVRQDASALPIMASVVRNGLRTLYRFEDWRLNPALDASLFRFTPPVGVTRVPFVSVKEVR